MAHKINASKCVECGCCEGVCSAGAILSGTPYRIAADKCVDCGICMSCCPVEAIDRVVDAAVSPALKRNNCDMKVAIVGVEGSGKTVMLAGLGALFSQPNADGVFITPKNFKTLTYVDRLMSMLKSGQWPAATAEDVMQGLDWVVRQRVDNARPVQLGEISLLDFAGEVYRAAFVQDEGENKAVENEIARLKKYLVEADCILVLVNLSDVIANGPFNARVEESVWITNAILDYVLPETRSDGKKLPRAAIVLSQADSYASTIEECGGPKQTLQRYLPHVANNYGWLDTFAVCTVDKTVLDEEGRPVPAPDFSPKGLAPIMEWVLKK